MTAAAESHAGGLEGLRERAKRAREGSGVGGDTREMPRAIVCLAHCSKLRSRSSSGSMLNAV
jgi:hypothetical protein